MNIWTVMAHCINNVTLLWFGAILFPYVTASPLLISILHGGTFIDYKAYLLGLPVFFF